MIWVYKHVTTTKLYGVIPIYKSSKLFVCGKDQKRYASKTKNSSEIINFLQPQIDQYHKGVFYGYSPELENMFNKNFVQMLSMSEEVQKQ